MRKNVKKVRNYIIQFIYIVGTILFYTTLYNASVLYYLDYAISHGYYVGLTKFQSIFLLLKIGFGMLMVLMFAVIKAIKDTQNLKNN